MPVLTSILAIMISKKYKKFVWIVLTTKPIIRFDIPYSKIKMTDALSFFWTFTLVWSPIQSNNTMRSIQLSNIRITMQLTYVSICTHHVILSGAIWRRVHDCTRPKRYSHSSNECTHILGNSSWKHTCYESCSYITAVDWKIQSCNGTSKASNLTVNLYPMTIQSFLSKHNRYIDHSYQWPIVFNFSITQTSVFVLQQSALELRIFIMVTIFAFVILAYVDQLSFSSDTLCTCTTDLRYNFSKYFLFSSKYIGTNYEIFLFLPRLCIHCCLS